MSSPFLGEIKVFAFNYPPRGWATCDGQLLAIQQNQALFSLLGTTYGGNGTTTFALPDLRGRMPEHFGAQHGDSYVQGEKAGTESVVLTTSGLPAHTHVPQANSGSGTSRDPRGNVWAAATVGTERFAATPNTTMSSAAVAPAGSGFAHANMQPYLVLEFAIALQGIFPSRN